MTTLLLLHAAPILMVPLVDCNGSYVTYSSRHNFNRRGHSLEAWDSESHNGPDPARVAPFSMTRSGSLASPFSRPSGISLPHCISVNTCFLCQNENEIKSGANGSNLLFKKFRYEWAFGICIHVGALEAASHIIYTGLSIQ
jgi:hypothetical protein